MFTARHAAGVALLAAAIISTHALAGDDVPDDAADDVIEAPVCSAAAIADAYRSASSIVSVRAPHPNGVPISGIGFVFHSQRHVATTLSLVESGRGIEVWIDDEQRAAVVVAFSRPRDIAILKLDRAVAAPPLVAATRPLPIGEPLLALGRSSMEAGADAVITPGIVRGKADGHLRSSALDGPQLNWGAPLLDCAGDVVGIAVDVAGDRLVPASALIALVPTIDDSGDSYRAGWSFSHPLIHFHGHIGGGGLGTTPDGWLGVGVGSALVGDDRWYFPFEARALFLTGPRTRDPLFERRGARFQLAAGAGYRFLLSGGELPVYLVPTAGGVVSYETIEADRTRLALAADCDIGAGCALTSFGTTYVDNRLRVMPTAGLSLQVGFATFGYQLQLDPIAPSQSIHQLTVGFQF